MPSSSLFRYAALLLTGLSCLLSSVLTQAMTVTQTETFNSFSCSAWVAVPNHTSKSYIRQCSNGWIAVSTPVGFDNDSITEAAGNTALITSGSGGNPAPSAEVRVGNNDDKTGNIWLYKSFAVEPGSTISSVSLQYAFQISDANRIPKYEIQVYDGRVTNLLAGKLPASLASQSGNGCQSSSFCGYTTFTATNLMPSSSAITVAFKTLDGWTGIFAATVYSRLDNVSVVQNVTTPAPASGDLAQAWAARYHSFVGAGEAADVVTDSAGNVYVTGRSHNGTNYDIVTVKYDSAGNQLWATTPYDGGDSDLAVALAVDGSGNVFVTGQSHNGTDFDYITLQYDSSGAQQWATPYDNGGNEDVPVGIALDGSGNVVVSGRSCVGTICDYATVQYDGSSGGVITGWPQLYDNGDNDEAVALGVDGANNVYVTGRSKGTTQDIATVKYNSSGTQQWVRRYDSTNNDFGVDLAVDNAGNSYVSGRFVAGGTASNDFVTIKYDTTGAQLWSETYDSGLLDIPAAVTVDGSGNVYVTGNSGPPGGSDITTVKYNSGGVQQWTASFDNSGANDEAVAVAVDGNGDVFVAGNSRSSDTDYVTIHYTAAGALAQFLTFDNSGDDVVATALALGQDTSGNTTVHVTGKSFGGMDNDYATVKYSVMQPDLAVTNVSGPASAFNDQAININNTIQNIQDPANGKFANAGSFDVSLYLAPNVGGSPDLGSLISLGSRNIASLASGVSNTNATPISIPGAGTVSAGSYYLVAVADSGSVVSEKDESNNTGVSSATIAISDAPDLTPTAVSGPASSPAGGAITINYTIENLRTPAVGSFNSSFVLSTDTTIGNGDDIALGTDAIASLAGNSSVNDTASVTIPGATAPGNYYIGVKADSGTAIAELDETNNTLRSTGTITVTGISDLSLTAISGPYGVVQGNQISVTNTVKNNGVNVNTPFVVGMYLSTDMTITTGDTFLGSRTINSILAGATDTDNTLVTVPGGVSVGAYYLGAIVDVNNNVTENDETNNSLDGWQITVASSTSGTDLVISDVSGPTSAARGDTISVDTTVQNVFNTAAGAFKVGIFLSNDGTITTSDTLLGDRSLTSLAGNSSDTASTNVTIPLGLYVNYNYRKSITIDSTKVSGTQTNFPVLVSFTDPDLRTTANGGKVENASGYDIIFRALDGFTPLDFEVESYTATTGQLVAWVRMPTLSGSANTSFYMYYGSSAVTASQENPNAVWLDDYRAVYHENQTPGVSSQLNSTPYGVTLSNLNMQGAASLVDAKIGKGINFDGTNDYQESSGNFMNPGNTDWTIEVWARSLRNAGSNEIIVQTEDGSGTGRSLIYKNNPNYHIDSYHNGTAYDSTQTMSVGPWYHIVLVHNNSANQLRWYINGALKTTNNGVAVESNNPSSWLFGRTKASNAPNLNYFRGILDEIRLSLFQRSANWIATEYRNQDSPSTFYTVGTEENVSGAQTFYLGAIADYALDAGSDITWTNALGGVTVTTNSLSKTGANGWNAGAASTQSLTGDGAVEFTATETNTNRMFGLSNSDPDQNYTSINYALYINAAASLNVYENGTYRGNFGTYTGGDVLRVERIGNTVVYKKNGTQFYTSRIPSSGTLIADTSLHTTGATITNARIYKHGTVAELNETNNSRGQTAGVGGSPEGTSVSVLTQLNVSGTDTNSGGGALGLIELMLGLVGLGIVTVRRRLYLSG